MKTLLSTALVTLGLSLSPLALAQGKDKKDVKKETKDHCEKNGKTVHAKDQAKCEKKGGKWIAAVAEQKAPESGDKAVNAPSQPSQPAQPSQPEAQPAQH